MKKLSCKYEMEEHLTQHGPSVLPDLSAEVMRVCKLLGANDFHLILRFSGLHSSLHVSVVKRDEKLFTRCELVDDVELDEASGVTPPSGVQ